MWQEMGGSDVPKTDDFESIEAGCGSFWDLGTAQWLIT
jgi:hypothetical protein